MLALELQLENQRGCRRLTPTKNQYPNRTTGGFMVALEWTDCPDPDCRTLATITDRYWVEGSPNGVWMTATHCARNHRYTTPNE